MPSSLRSGQQVGEAWAGPREQGKEWLPGTLRRSVWWLWKDWQMWEEGRSWKLFLGCWFDQLIRWWGCLPMGAMARMLNLRGLQTSGELLSKERSRAESHVGDHHWGGGGS